MADSQQTSTKNIIPKFYDHKKPFHAPLNHFTKLYILKQFKKAINVSNNRNISKES